MNRIQNHKFLTTIIIVLWMNISMHSAFCGNLISDGHKAYDQGDYKKAFSIYTKLAEQGNAKAQAGLGYMYLEGKGIPENMDEGFKWTLLAADQGEIEAQFLLGFYYCFTTDESSKDIQKGLRLWDLVGKNGGPNIQFLLSAMYLEGDEELFIPSDKQKGLNLLCSALDNEDTDEEYYFYIKEFGDLVHLDLLEEGIPLLQEIAEEGFADAQYCLGEKYIKGQMVPQDDEEAEKWFRLAADQGHADAHNWLYKMFVQGKIPPLNRQEAIQWYTQAGQEGYAEAQNFLGEMYLQGHDIAQDDQEAEKWFRLAADQGHADAQSWLYKMFVQGKVSPLNSQEGIQWYTQAAQEGHAEAQNKLGEMIAMGEGTDQDDKKAVKWFRSAAEQGNVDALINLGDCYLLSRGVDYSIQNASDCYIKAGDDAKSQKRLQMIATRGYLQNTLTVRSNNINQLVSRNEYVIFLPEENCLLYPLDGTVTITPEISEGKHVDIQTDIEKIGENLKVHFKIETDFLIQKLLLDSAPVPLDSLEPSEQPQYLLGEASVVVTPQHIADGFAITIVSRNDAEHVKRLSYNDGKLTVISAEDMLKY